LACARGAETLSASDREERTIGRQPNRATRSGQKTKGMVGRSRRRGMAVANASAAPRRVIFPILISAQFGPIAIDVQVDSWGAQRVGPIESLSRRLR
jgi:hypothetical protein